MSKNILWNLRCISGFKCFERGAAYLSEYFSNFKWNLQQYVRKVAVHLAYGT
jgi:hypothetical protein